MLRSSNFKCMTNCIRILGNFIALSDIICKKLVHEWNFLDVIKTVMAIGTKDHKREALWLISNIAANSELDSIALVKKGLVVNLIYASKDNNWEIKREAVWALSNICVSIHEAESLIELIHADVLSLFYDLLLSDSEYG